MRFFGDLILFLPRGVREVVDRELNERTSIKDVIEACGVPHTEVDRVIVSDKPVDFSHVLDEKALVGVYSVNLTKEGLPGTRLQARNISKFVLDGHLGKLARNLRLLGFDVFYQNDAQDRQLLAVMQAEERALITRDRRLLMHSIVQHGYCPRSQRDEAQTIEVLRRFDVADFMAPFTRCLTCNALLATVDKKSVVDRLKPLTKIYYVNFRRCQGCGKIFWGGSHFDKLRARVERIRAQL